MRGVRSAFFHFSTCWQISCHGSFGVANRWPSSCRGSNHLWEDTSAVRLRTSSDRRGAAAPACLAHRLPSLYRVVPQQPPPCHWLRREGRYVAVGPDGYPLRMHGLSIWLEVTKLLLLLGIQPPLTARLGETVLIARIFLEHGYNLRTDTTPLWMNPRSGNQPTNF